MPACACGSEKGPRVPRKLGRELPLVGIFRFGVLVHFFALFPSVMFFISIIKNHFFLLRDHF